MFDFKVSENVMFGVTMTISTLQEDDVKYHITFLPRVIVASILVDFHDPTFDICWHYTELE